MKLVGCCVGGTDVHEQDVYLGHNGHPIIFDDPNFDPYDENSNPFSTTPEHSPRQPEYRPPPRVRDSSAEVIELKDGFVLPLMPQHFELAEKLRQENSTSSANKTPDLKNAVEEMVQQNKPPIPIEVRVEIKEWVYPEGQYIIPARHTETKIKRNVDKSAEPYRVMNSPRKYQEFDLAEAWDGRYEYDSPRECAEVDKENVDDENKELFVYLEAMMPPEPQPVKVPEPEPVPEPEVAKPASRLKRFKRYIRHLLCWRPAIEPEPEEAKSEPVVPVCYPSLQTDDVTTLHVLRGDDDTDTGVCRAIRELRIRKKSCY